MRHTKAVARALVASMTIVTVAACGSSGGGEKSARTSSTTASTTTTTAPPDAATLATRLVTVADVPSGYSQQAPDPSSNDTSDLKICGGPSLEEIVDSASQAEVSFLGGTIGPALVEILSAYPSMKEASAVLVAAKAQLGSCTEFSQTDADGTTFNYTIAPLSAAKVGDDRVAVRLSTTVEAGSINADVVFVRSGATIVTGVGVSVLSVFGGGQVQPGQLDAFIAAAVKKAGSK